MKMKKLVALLLSMVMLVSAVGCGAKTKSEVTGGDTDSSGQTATASGDLSLKLLYQSADEVTANIIRDKLTKLGIEVEMAAAAESATYRDQLNNGNFDIAVFSWANPVGTPDYSARGIWHSEGDGNYFGINDATLDEMVESASTVTADQYADAYGAVEKYVTEEMAYMSPLYINVQGRAYNKVLDPETITVNQRWNELSYTDPAQNTERTLTLAQTGSTITTWDPIRANDSTSGYALDHMYIYLVTLQPDWTVSTDESLSYSYAISEDNTEYYFLLRDDCNFARVDENGEVYDSGVMVSGEDVVYSLERAKNPDSTPLHKVYSMYTNLDTVEIIDDISVLENTVTADGSSILEKLEADGGQSVSTLAATRDQVDNAAGSYQVVRCTTTVAYPQILNALAFHGAGIVDSEFVEAMNKDVDIAAYDATTDVLYGDSVFTKEGSDYANHLSLSGSYVLTSMTDYQLNFVANPCIRTNDTERNPITTIVDKLMSDTEANLSAVRSGEADMPYTIPVTKFDLVEQDENLSLDVQPGIRCYMLAFNMHGNSEVSNSADLRKAISSAINFSDIEAVMAGQAIECYSSLSTCLDAGNELSYQEGDTQKYLDAYFASKE